jgi:hypothetical protein
MRVISDLRRRCMFRRVDGKWRSRKKKNTNITNMLRVWPLLMAALILGKGRRETFLGVLGIARRRCV